MGIPRRAMATAESLAHRLRTASTHRRFDATTGTQPPNTVSVRALTRNFCKKWGRYWAPSCTASAPAGTSVLSEPNAGPYLVPFLTPASASIISWIPRFQAIHQRCSPRRTSKQAADNCTRSPPCLGLVFVLSFFLTPPLLTAHYEVAIPASERWRRTHTEERGLLREARVVCQTTAVEATITATDTNNTARTSWYQSSVPSRLAE